MEKFVIANIGHYFQEFFDQQVLIQNCRNWIAKGA